MGGLQVVSIHESQLSFSGYRTILENKQIQECWLCVSLYMVPLEHTYKSRPAGNKDTDVFMQFSPISSHLCGSNWCTSQKQGNFPRTLVSLHKENTMALSLNMYIILRQWQAEEKLTMFVYFYTHLHSIPLHILFAASWLGSADRWRQCYCRCQRRKSLHVQ